MDGWMTGWMGDWMDGWIEDGEGCEVTLTNGAEKPQVCFASVKQ